MTDLEEYPPHTDRRRMDAETRNFRDSVNDRLEEVKKELHNGDERFKSIDSQIAELRAELAANSVVTAETATSLAALTEVVNTIKAGLDKIADFMNTLNGGLKALEGLARISKAVGAIALAVGGVLTVWTAWPKK